MANKRKKIVIITSQDFLTESFLPNVTWYHGSDYDFSSFEEFKSSGPSALGIFFTDDRTLAELFGPNLYTATLNIKNPYKITMDKWDDIRMKHAKQTEYFQQMRQNLMNKGHDALFIKSRKFVTHKGIEFIDGNIVVVFDKRNIQLENKL